MLSKVARRSVGAMWRQAGRQRSSVLRTATAATAVQMSAAFAPTAAAANSSYNSSYSSRFFSAGAAADPTGEPSGEESAWIVDVTQDNFADVVMTSDVPVVLDCYADWCGPCRQLAPILEKEIAKAGGKVILAKLNTDNNPQLAQGLRVQSLPTVLAVHQGQIVSTFTGLQPENVIEDFFEKLVELQGEGVVETPEKNVVKGLDALAAYSSGKDTSPEILDTAKEHLSLALQLGNITPEASDGEKLMMANAYGGLVQIALAQGDKVAAGQVAEALRTAYPGQLSAPVVSRALSQHELAMGAGGSVEGTAELEAAIEANPDDHESRLALAAVLLAEGHNEAAIEHLLESIRRDASWNGAAARTQLLKVFESLGNDNPLVGESRRKLANLLF